MSDKVILRSIKRLCAMIILISAVLITIAYIKHMKTLGMFSCGVLIPALLTEVIANPIEEEDEDGD